MELAEKERTFLTVTGWKIARLVPGKHLQKKKGVILDLSNYPPYPTI